MPDLIRHPDGSALDPGSTAGVTQRCKLIRFFYTKLRLMRMYSCTSLRLLERAAFFAADERPASFVRLEGWDLMPEAVLPEGWGLKTEDCLLVTVHCFLTLSVPF